MFTEERLEQILNILDKNGRVKVKDLSELFNVFRILKYQFFSS